MVTHEIDIRYFVQFKYAYGDITHKSNIIKYILDLKSLVDGLEIELKVIG